jgi:hypothetical protein
MVWLGEAALAAGRPAEAEEQGDEARRLARDHDERGHEAWALRLLGEIRARQSPADVDRAIGFYRDAMALARGRGMRPLVARILLGLSDLPSPVPSNDGADALEQAVAMLGEMNLTPWLDRATAALTRRRSTHPG